MAVGKFEQCLAITLSYEGGYGDHPADPGGATNLGVTRRVLAEWRGRAVSKDEVRALTRREAAAIYRKRYWDAVGGDSLPSGVDLAVFDYAVNSGPGRAARSIQACCGVERDGVVGAQTLAAIHRMAASHLISAISTERRGFLGRLGIFAVFGRGWMRRVAGVEKLAIEMARPPHAGSTTAKGSTQETKTMTFSKSMLESRTVWANIVGMAALGASMLGFNTGLIDQGAVVDAVLQGVTGASFVASTLFRVIATKRIG